MGSETESLRKRFSVWSDVLMEQEIVQSFQSGAKLRKKIPKNVVKQERDVEDYLHDVPSGKIRPGRMDRRVKPGSKKATRKIKKNKKPGTGDGKANLDKSAAGTSKSKKRKLKKKARKLSPATDIALKLTETRIDLIQNVVETLGEEMAFRLMTQTLEVEAAGGIMTCNGSRRRTPGGVFFHLVKNDSNVTPEQSRKIFGEESFVRKRVSQKQKKSLDKISIGLDSITMGSGDADATATAAAVSSAILQDVTAHSENSEK